MPQITVQLSKKFRRPIEVVRSQFGDIEHHRTHEVHKGVKFTIHSDDGATVRFRQEAKLFGFLPQVDEIVLRRDDGGRVVQDFVSGVNAGSKLVIEFRPDGSDTRVDAVLTAPTRGVKRLLAPLFKVAVERLAGQALEEDRVDLEERNYQPRA